MSSPSTPATDHIASSVLGLVGRTPMVRLLKFERETPGVEIYAKAEWQNPGGSVKDRAAARMIADGEASGRLRPGLTIIDATSGNTGIAYAMVGAARGYQVKLCLPDNASQERKLILRAFGVELILTDPLEGTDGAIREVRRLVAEAPERYFYPDQYSNESNWRAHYDTTAPEIIEQTGGRLTHFVAGLGTSGTFVGTGRALRRFNPAIKLISFQPDSPFHGLEGLKHMASAMVPAIYDPTLADEDLGVSSEDAYALVRRLAREEGLLVGISSGAALAATLTVARRLQQGVVVTVFPDGAEKYLSESFWTADAEQRVVLDKGIGASIRRHGEETYPHECCGALVGGGGRVTAAVPLPNTTEEGPRRRFLVRPSDYRLAEQQAAALNGELLGFYHSHPDHPARPSQFDLDHAWPNFAYVIVSIQSAEARQMTVWFLKEDRSSFDEGELHGDENFDSDSAQTVHGQEGRG